MAKFKVLSTKKLDPSLVEKAKDAGVEIVEQEFISTKPVRNKETFNSILSFAERGLYNVVVTSANAVDALNSYMLAEDTCWVINWRFFCLSGKTKKAIQAARFLQKEIGAEAANAASLAKKIIDLDIKEIIFFCGNKRRDELPGILTNAGVVVHEIVVYETLEIPVIVGKDFDALVFFSPSGVQSFFAANEPKDGAVCFAIGPTTATSIATFTNNQVVASIAPDPKELIEEVIAHFKHKSTVE